MKTKLSISMATLATLSVLFGMAVSSVQAQSKRTIVVHDHRTSAKPKVTVRRTRRTTVHDHRTTSRPSRVNDRRIPPRRANQNAPKSDYPLSVAEASRFMARYKEWMIGANATGLVYPKSSNYNLKGKNVRKFLQYEKQGTGRGINLGWTSNASANTARARSLWNFQNQANSNRPIRYGEPIAIAGMTDRAKYIKYASRNVGINLDWSKKPSYEWAILGGRPGTPVKRGQDWVVIYNLRHKQPLIYYKRSVGGYIGWPDSRRWNTGTIGNPQYVADMRAAVKVLLMPGVPGGN